MVRKISIFPKLKYGETLKTHNINMQNSFISTQLINAFRKFTFEPKKDLTQISYLALGNFDNLV